MELLFLACRIQGVVAIRVFLFLEGPVARESRYLASLGTESQGPARPSVASSALHSGRTALQMRVGCVVFCPVPAPSPSTVTAAGYRSSRGLCGAL